MASDPQGARPDGAPANPRGYVMRALAIGTAAIVILPFPCPPMAQEAAGNVSIKHVALAETWRQPTPALPAVPVDRPATILPSSIVQSGDVAAIGTIRSHAGGGEWAGGTFHLAACADGRSPGRRRGNASNIGAFP